MMVKQWVIFRDTRADQALRQLLRAESMTTGESMSAIVRDALTSRYYIKAAESGDAQSWLEEALEEAALEDAQS